MQDAPFVVAVNKVGNDTGKSLAGATLSVIDADTDEELYSKVTEGEIFFIPSELLKAGTLTEGATTYKEYILRETGLPSGYAQADDIKFALDEKGNLYVDGGNGYELQNANIIKMVDNRDAIYVSKQDLGGTEVPGATITITSTEDTDFETVTFVSTESPTRFELTKFKRNTKYILTEVGAPSGYAYTESIEFYIDDSDMLYVNGESVEDGIAKLVDKAIDPKVVKKDGNTGENLAGAQFDLILAETGECIYSFVSTEGEVQLPSVKFDASTEEKQIVYILHESVAPEGYEVAEDIKFYISSDGNLYIFDREGNANLKEDGIITVLDSKIETGVTKKPNETSKTTVTAPESNSKTSTNVKTGDNAPLKVVAALMLVSLVALMGTGICRKLKKETDED
jgi:hypothetical protein